MSKSLVLLSLSVLFSLPSLADTYYVEQVAGEAAYTGQSDLAGAVRGIITHEVVSLGHQVIEDPNQAQWRLSPSIYSLGGAYLMTLSKSKAGRVVFSQKLKAESEADLDRASEQLVRAAVKGKTSRSQEAVNIGDKQAVFKQAYFGFGPGYLSGLQADTSGVAWAAGYLWGLDSQFALRLNVDGVNGSDSGADTIMLGVGGQYYFNNLKHAPYALGLIGHSWSDSEDASACTSCTGDSEHGWAVQIGAGMHFYRNSVVNLAVELTYARGFYDVVSENPGATALKLVILW